MTVEDRQNRMDEAVKVAEPTASSETPDDPAAIRADIAATRTALGSTVEELADRVNPVTQSKAAVRRLRRAGDDVVDAAIRWRLPLAVVTAVVATAVTWALIRRQHR